MKRGALGSFLAIALLVAAAPASAQYGSEHSLRLRAGVFTPDGDAFDYSLGASVTVLGGLSIGVAYVGVDGPGGPAFDGITDDTVVGTLGFAF